MTTRVPVLSLYQPFAELLVRGIKVHETRRWLPPPAIIGRRIYIHAGLRLIPEWVGPELDRLCRERLGAEYFAELPRGALVGSVRVLGAVSTEHATRASEEDLLAGDWRHGRKAWHCAEPERFEQPIPLRGRQRVWWVERELLRGAA